MDFSLRLLRMVMVMCCLVLALGPANSGPARADDDDNEGTIQVNPAEALPGDTVRISGSGLPANEDGDLLWADLDEDISGIQTTGDGTFVVDLVVPDFEPGTYRIAVEIESADASANLTVLHDKQRQPEPTEELIATEVPTVEPGLESPTPESSESATEDNKSSTDPTATVTSTEVSAVSAAPGNELWVAVDGSDSGDGSNAKPFRTLQKALDVVVAGQTINLKAGTFTLNDTALSKRNGTAAKPIVIQSGQGSRAVISGPSSEHGLQIEHDWYVIRNLEFANADILLWLDGASNVVISGNLFHDAGGECVRIKNQSKNNTFSGNVVRDCGREGFDLASGSKNGEGVYVGTAPEQRSKIGGVPDQSTGNIIENNTFATNGSEGVDLKEDAEYNIVRNNVARGNRDPEGANFGSRGDKNTFTGNESYESAGAGFRAGGDTVGGRVYGKNNVYRSNYSHDNAGHSFKFMVGPQDVDCSNSSSNNAGEEYYFGTSEFDISCDGGSNPTATPKPTKTATPGPTKTPTPRPGSLTFIASADAQAAAHVPGKNYGNSGSFRVDNAPNTVAYLKFKVSGVSEDEIERVTLRLYLLDTGGGSLQLYSVGSTSWSESSITWNSRPRLGTAISSSSAGSDSGGVWVEFDVTDTVTRSGTFAFALVTTSNDGYSFTSSEAGSMRPHLVVKLK